jgi:hypothetical protein
MKLYAEKIKKSIIYLSMISVMSPSNSFGFKIGGMEVAGIVGKICDGDMKGAADMTKSAVKKIGQGIKAIVQDPKLLAEFAQLGAQCSPAIAAAVGGDYILVIKDFMSNGPCTQLNRKCSGQFGELVCPNLDGIRDELVKVCSNPAVSAALSQYQEAAQYCSGTVSLAQQGAFQSNDNAFGGRPTMQDMGMAQAAYDGNDGKFLQEILKEAKEQRKDLLENHKKIIDSILQANEQQMKQLLEMQNEQFNKFVMLNENQRRDFLQALEKNNAHSLEVIKSIESFASEGRSLDHETIMDLIKGGRSEREAIYKSNKEEIDRLIAEYNDKLKKSAAERDAAVKKLNDITNSLNRQIVTANIVHAACTRAINDYTWCANISNRKNQEQCAQFEEQKDALCN